MQEEIDTSYGIIAVRGSGATAEILIVKHVNGGHWGFPKGHPEGRETAAATAIREFREETGITDIKIENTPVLKQKYDFVRDGVLYHKNVVYFFGVVRSGRVRVRPGEISDYRWAGLNELEELLTVDGKNRETVETITNLLSSRLH